MRIGQERIIRALPRQRSSTQQTRKPLARQSQTRRLIEEFNRRPPAAINERLVDLTEREREVLELLARGLSNQELSERLFIADNTIKTHVKRILTKLGARDRAQAVVIAYESGLVR